MPTVNMHEAKTQLSRLVERARQGEEILIARAGEPVARLVAITEEPARPTARGMLRGRVRYLGSPEEADAAVEALLEAKPL